MREPVEAYFSELSMVRCSGAGVAETSYYGAIGTLLTAVGAQLKPHVRAVGQLRNIGAGAPDFGLFAQKQFQHAHDAAPLPGQKPERGAVEVKSPAEDIRTTLASEQVARYAREYGAVLVTNLRDFALVRWDASRESTHVLETCSLSRDEAHFWANCAHPQLFAQTAGEGLAEFLQRVMLHPVPIAAPKDVAWWLASYARTARLRLEHRDLPALAQLRTQLEEALGLKFEGEKGDHFFRSTLVQTLFYGVFASWVLWARDPALHTGARFRWREAVWTLQVPMIAQLFEQIATPSKLGELQIAEVLDWTEEVLNRIDRVQFFSRFREEHAVQYFYEPFLEAFDPELRKELGVWYTPDEVVRYMVARVDTVLREELGIADGLADESVVVLDPCCGTGAYLVEVLRKIDETLTVKGADALTRQDVKRAAMSRVIGFEIMPAPYVVAHLQMGILLAELGVPLRDADERAAIYLTNALTGWGDGTTIAPPRHPKVGPGQMHSTLLFPEFAEERDAANRVKREEKVLVILGNPPYNRYVAIAADEERDLSDAYRSTARGPKPQGMGLNDLYVRFFRLAERQIVERSGMGVVSFISNYSWLDGLSYTGMRERLLEAFDDVYVDNLHGDRIVSEYAPDGRTSETVFAMGSKSPGIKVGICVSTLVCMRAETHGTAADALIHYRDFEQARATERTAAMIASLQTGEPAYRGIHPLVELGFPFRPRDVGAGYFEWPRLPDIFPMAWPGVSTGRDAFLVDIDEEALRARVSTYFDVSIQDEEVRQLCPKVMESTRRFDAPSVRRTLQARGPAAGAFVSVAYRPFDVRWLYWDPDTKLLDEKRVPLRVASQAGGAFLIAQQKPRREWSRPQWVNSIPSLDLMDRGAQAFPSAALGESSGQLGLSKVENLTPAASRFVAASGSDPEQLMFHVMAVTYSPAYAVDNAGALRQDWPRVPLPADSEQLRCSVSLGSRIASVLGGSELPESVRWNLPTGLGVLSRVGGGPLSPAELAITARWGKGGAGGIAMPSKGKLTERPYSTDERAALAKSAESLSLTAAQATALLGETCFDVYLNDVAYWTCVPANVWRYTIGGYQVIKKWLSYRERALLDRDLKPEEARYVTEMVCRIAALVLMQPELDANYERVKADVWEWPHG